VAQGAGHGGQRAFVVIEDEVCARKVVEKRSKTQSVVFAKVDTEAEQALAAAAQITSIPTLMAFKDGTLVFAQPGALPPQALDQLVSAVRDLDIEAARRDNARLVPAADLSEMVSRECCSCSGSSRSAIDR